MATVAELRAAAKRLGLNGCSKLNKQQLEGLIIRHNLEMQKAAREQQEATTSKPTQTKEPQAPVQEVKPERVFPTPKSRKHVYDFSKCKDAETLRKTLNAGSIDTLKAIAESYREFQPRSDEKHMTKKFYVYAIVKLYFPDYQPKAPAPVQEAPKVRYPFVSGEIYIKCKKQDSRKIELVKVLRRKGEYITVQEVSYPELEPISKPVRVKLQHDRYLTQEGFLLDSRDITDFKHKEQDRIYSHPDHKYSPEYYQPRKPDTKNDKMSELLSIPAHDMAFDEIAYTPERQDNLAVLDDIPEDHEPDIQKALPNNRSGFTRFEIGDVFVVREQIYTVTKRRKNFVGSEYVYLVDQNGKTSECQIDSWRSGVLPENARCINGIPADEYICIFHLLDVDKVCSAQKNTVITPKHQPEQVEPKHQAENIISCSQHKAKDEHSKPLEQTHAPVQEVKKAVTLPRLEKCPHCGSKHKPYFIYRTENNYSYTSRHYGDLGPAEWKLATLRCRDCGYEETVYFRTPYPEREEAMKKVVGKWCLNSSLSSTSKKQKQETRKQRIDANGQGAHKAAEKQTAPATKKAQKRKKYDDSRQLVFDFEIDDEPVEVKTPAVKASKPRRTKRIKPDYSRQILIDFGEDISDGKIYKREAA